MRTVLLVNIIVKLLIVNVNISVMVQGRKQIFAVVCGYCVITTSCLRRRKRPKGEHSVGHKNKLLRGQPTKQKDLKTFLEVWASVIFLLPVFDNAV